MRAHRPHHGRLREPLPGEEVSAHRHGVVSPACQWVMGNGGPSPVVRVLGTPWGRRPQERHSTEGVCRMDFQGAARPGQERRWL